MGHPKESLDEQLGSTAIEGMLEMREGEPCVMYPSRWELKNEMNWRFLQK